MDSLMQTVKAMDFPMVIRLEKATDSQKDSQRHLVINLVIQKVIQRVTQMDLDFVIDSDFHLAILKHLDLMKGFLKEIPMQMDSKKVIRLRSDSKMETRLGIQTDFHWVTQTEIRMLMGLMTVIPTDFR